MKNLEDLNKREQAEYLLQMLQTQDFHQFYSEDLEPYITKSLYAPKKEYLLREIERILLD